MTTIAAQPVRTLGRSLLLLVTVLAILTVAPGGLLRPNPAAASHAGLMTLRGKVTVGSSQYLSGATVKEYYWTGSAWTQPRTVYTDANGNYAVVAGRGHYFQLSAERKVGTSCWGGIWSWYGYTDVFYTYGSWANPTYINIPVSGGRVC